ncbi:hypothetical protein C8R44DRAFT_745989 [Mycena epipterygia]|nr:hypothetical protein C8R44DRAFT_745989 [Mycena epipterygia]
MYEFIPPSPTLPDWVQTLARIPNPLLSGSTTSIHIGFEKMPDLDESILYPWIRTANGHLHQRNSESGKTPIATTGSSIEQSLIFPPKNPAPSQLIHEFDGNPEEPSGPSGPRGVCGGVRGSPAAMDDLKKARNKRRKQKIHTKMKEKMELHAVGPATSSCTTQWA